MTGHDTAQVGGRFRARDGQAPSVPPKPATLMVPDHANPGTVDV